MLSVAGYQPGISDLLIDDYSPIAITVEWNYLFTVAQGDIWKSAAGHSGLLYRVELQSMPGKATVSPAADR